MTMITPSYLGETIEYSSLHACRSTLEDPTPALFRVTWSLPECAAFWDWRSLGLRVGLGSEQGCETWWTSEGERC